MIVRPRWPCSATRATWISSGDKVADRATGDRFVAAYEAKHAIAREGDTAKLVIGNDDFPFAFPIVKTGDRWHFDTEAGKDELLARRIGANELDAIKVLQAIVDAQRDYASEDRNGDGVLDYAQKFVSSPGKHDGLYWPAKAGEPASPLGALVAEAAGQGYRKGEKGPTPYHGYYLPDAEGSGKERRVGRGRLRREGARDRRLRRRCVSGEIRQLRHHDVHRQSGRQGLPGRSRTEVGRASSQDAAVRPGQVLDSGEVAITGHINPT